MNKLHKKDFSIAFKTGTDANKSKFKKEAVQGEMYFATDSKNLYVAETTAGAIDATLAQFIGPEIFNVTTRDTEVNILASTPTNPSGEVNIAFGTDTNDFYIYDGSAWYIYNTDSFVNTYSVNLDGTNDLVRVSHDASLNISGDFTMSAWVYFTGTASGNIMSKRGTTGTPHWQWYIDTNNSNKPTFRGSSTSNTVATTGISTNTWTHLMVVSGGTQVAHYINGTLSGFSPNTLGTANSNDVTIGAVDYPSNGSPVGNFAGYIDEVSLFDTQSTALTTALSTSLPTDLTSLSPLGWWRMGDDDGGTGTTVTDQGSGGNNGTLQNGAAFSTTVPS